MTSLLASIMAVAFTADELVVIYAALSTMVDEPDCPPNMLVVREHMRAALRKIDELIEDQPK